MLRNVQQNLSRAGDLRGRYLSYDSRQWSTSSLVTLRRQGEFLLFMSHLGVTGVQTWQGFYWIFSTMKQNKREMCTPVVVASFSRWDLSMYPRLALNSTFSSSLLPSAGIICMHHHAHHGPGVTYLGPSRGWWAGTGESGPLSACLP